MELIDRDALMKNICKNPAINGNHRAAQLLDCIIHAPSIEATLVRRGRWVDKMVRDWHCSECDYQMAKVRHFDGYCYDDKPNFCPNCGAKMDLEG